MDRNRHAEAAEEGREHDEPAEAVKAVRGVENHVGEPIAEAPTAARGGVREAVDGGDRVRRDDETARVEVPEGVGIKHRCDSVEGGAEAPEEQRRPREGAIGRSATRAVGHHRTDQNGGTPGTSRRVYDRRTPWRR